MILIKWEEVIIRMEKFSRDLEGMGDVGDSEEPLTDWQKKMTDDPVSSDDDDIRDVTNPASADRSFMERKPIMEVKMRDKVGKNMISNKGPFLNSFLIIFQKIRAWGY